MSANIILIVVDSLRRDHVGPATGLTPELDRLAEECASFSQAISAGPSTRVSMSAMLSSTYASLHGGQLRLSPTRPMGHTALRRTGYKTAGVTSNLYLSRTFGWARDFDYFDDCRPEAYYKRKLWLRAASQVTRRLGRPLGWPRSLPAAMVFENAKRFLAATRAPFFLWTHLMDVHWPYSIQRFSWDRAWHEKCRADEVLRPRMLSDPPQLTEEEAHTLAEEYRAAVRYTDAQLGAFVASLRAAGRLRDSWLFITADHGEQFREHGRFFHPPSLYDEQVCVPLLVRPPDTLALRRGWRVEAQVRLVDLVPTFLDIAGAAPAPGVELIGSSLLPFIEERPGAASDPRPALIESPKNEVLALRAGGWKYVWHVAVDRRELFDLHADPGEQRDRSATARARADSMHAALARHQAAVRAASSTSEQPEVDDTVIARLRDLGYVD